MKSKRRSSARSTQSTRFDLPQVCITCRKLKAARLGKFISPGHRYSQWLWRCDACQDSAVPRLSRPGKESPAEREARSALVRLRAGAVAEYPLGGYLFDFAVPKLRLLIELDSRYHHSAGRRRRDRLKSETARDKLWKLVRLSASPGVGTEVMRVVLARRQELGN